MRTGQQFHRVSQVAVPSDCTVVITIEADNLGQHVSVTSVALCPRGGVPLPVARCRQWIDREHLVAGCAQRGDPWATVGLDTDDHLTGALLWRQVGPHRRGVLGHQRVQSGDALQALRQPDPCEPATVLILDLEIVVILSPVVSNEQHPATPPDQIARQITAPGDTRNLMIKCSRRGGHDIPSAVSHRRTGERTVCQ